MDSNGRISENVIQYNHYKLIETRITLEKQTPIVFTLLL